MNSLSVIAITSTITLTVSIAISKRKLFLIWNLNCFFQSLTSTLCKIGFRWEVAKVLLNCSHKVPHPSSTLCIISSSECMWKACGNMVLSSHLNALQGGEDNGWADIKLQAETFPESKGLFRWDSKDGRCKCNTNTTQALYKRYTNAQTIQS